ncbi:MAG TPA: hypothetical protein VLB46_01055 [Pyrinomonadaceae bacterium]|nr:hypothetical protein [Pyrinomonadaceae bacterium]
MNRYLHRLTLLIVVPSAIVCGRAHAQSTSDWIRRQQQQQQQQQQRQQQELQRQQQQQQQRQQMQQQQRLQQQQQMRQQMQQQQRQQAQQQMRQQQPGVGRTPASGTSRLGTFNDRSGFIGKTTRDGRSLAMINGRVLAVPNTRAALSGRGYSQSQTSRWSDAKRATVSAEFQKLATASLKERVRSGGPGGLKEKFNDAAGNGGGRSGGNGGQSGGGNGRSGGNSGSGPKKGDLTRTFNNAARNKPKKNQDKPTPRLTPKPSPTPNGPRP